MTETPARRHQAIPVLQASMDSPPFARLAELSRESNSRLKAIQPLLPASLVGSITAGPIDGVQWCLLVDNSAAAAKLRQMLPALVSHLRAKGYGVEAIRLKVHKG